MAALEDQEDYVLMERGGHASRESIDLLTAAAPGVPPELIEFVGETIGETVGGGSEMTGIEIATLLEDAGIEIDEDEVEEICECISILTKPPVETAEDELDDGTCQLCERDTKRTFHHLIPMETHKRYLKKGRLPANMSGGELTRVWLNTYGVMICRPCHTAVHLAEKNEVLAEEFNSLERLLSHPKIASFAKYNSKRVGRR